MVEYDAEGADAHNRDAVLIAVEAAAGNPDPILECSFFHDLVQDPSACNLAFDSVIQHIPLILATETEAETGVDPDNVELVIRCLYD